MADASTSVGPITIGGSPTEAEVAAIVAAIEMSWPKPMAAPTAPPSQSTRWRHSDRWWAEGRLPNTWR